MDQTSLGSGKLREEFFKEALERLRELECGLLNMEQGLDRSEQIRLIFRGFHGLKGIALYVDAREIIDLTNGGERLMVQVRDEEVEFQPQWTDVLLDCHDVLKGLVQSFYKATTPPDDWKTNLRQLDRIIDENSKVKGRAAAEQSPVALFHETAEAQLRGLKIYFDKWKDGVPDKKLVQAVSRKLRLISTAAANAGRQDLREMIDQALDSLNARRAEAWDREQIEAFSALADRFRSRLKTERVRNEVAVSETSHSVPTSAPGEPAVSRVEIRDEYVEMLEDLVGDFSVYCETVAHQIESMKPLVKPRAHVWLSGMASDLEKFGHAFKKSLRRLHLVPISTVLDRFPRLVRDIAKREGKNVRLVVTGGETELERYQAERLSEPLVHLVRNAVGHGIEDPDERQRAGKSYKGTVKIEVTSSKGFVTVEVRDDGRGIDCEEVRRKAVELGLLDPADRSGTGLIGLIFLAGLSTAKKADTIVGRGVGMDIVRQAMQGLGGTVDVSSEPGKGSSFRLTLPFDLA